MKNEIQTAAVKQEYQAPMLSEIGSMSELTLNGAAVNPDANGMSV